MPIKYVPYAPQPVEGQAVLNNITRTRRLLTYRGADGAERRIARGLPLYDVAVTEVVNGAELFAAEAGNLLLSGSCLAACAYLKDRGVTVDLVYIDPPFASGADYTKTIYVRRNPKAAAELMEAEEELDGEDLLGLEHTLYGDIWTKETYLDWMFENLVAIKAVMSPKASIYVHLDSHIVHYVKVMMDEIFLEENFRGQIVWKRTSAHSNSKQGRASYGQIHDNILFYTLSSEWAWNEQYGVYDEDYARERFRHEDQDGRRFKDADLSAAKPGGDTSYLWRIKRPVGSDSWQADIEGEFERPKEGYKYRGVPPPKGRYWAYSRENMRQFAQDNLLYHTVKGTPRLKQYADKMQGVPLQDLWSDIPPVNSQAGERVDYDTQKPEALLERIIAASSDEGTLVADFFGGSGTTARAAHKLGRRFMTADVGINSLQTSRDTLRDAGAVFTVVEVQDGVALFRNPAQTMDRLAELIPGLAKGGVLAPWFGQITDPTLGPVPVFLPNLVDTNSRVLDAPALNRLLTILPDVGDATRKVIVYYVDVEDLDTLAKFERANNPTTINVEFRDLKEVLAGAVMEDHVEASVLEEGGRFVVTLKQFVSDRLIQAVEVFNQKKNLPRQASLYDGTDQAEKEAAFLKAGGLTLSDEGLEGIEAVFVDAKSADGPWTTDAEVRIDKKGFAIRDGKKTKDLWDGTVKLDKCPLRLKARSVLGDETIISLVTPGS